jgi:hypothetical protein
MEEERKEMKSGGQAQSIGFCALTVSNARGLTDTVLEHVRDGRFQRSLCLIAAGTSAVTGLEVAYEHYKGSYSNPVMYTPVILSGVVAGAGVLGFFNRWAARTLLRWVSAITLADGVIGFFFHVRGIARKPGGWRLPVTNIVMGPPIAAPLLFGTSAYLGFMASYLRREEERPGEPEDEEQSGRNGWREELRYGRFQKHMAAVTFAWTLFCGFEALYSHYKSNFRMRVQWSPIILTPLLLAGAAGSLKSKRIAHTLLPAASALAMADGVVGGYFHVCGIGGRPGGWKKPVYNILHGPPIFAPMLFAACGFLGMMASLLRRENR